MVRLLFISFFISLSFMGFSQCDPDTEPPSVICPLDLVYDNDPGECSALVIFSPFVLKRLIPPQVNGDNCGGFLTTVTGNPSDFIFPVGTTTLTYRVSDTAGNFVECTQQVTILDTEAPSVNAVDPATTEADPGLCSAFVSVPIATAIDNCGSSTVITNNYNSNGPDASDVYPVGTTVVTFTASDGTFSSTFDIEVVVVNTQIPEISLLGNNEITLEACSEFNDPGATAIDNCLGDISAEIQTTSNLDTNVPGTYTIEYNITNALGVSGTPVTRTINVEDRTIPVLALNGDDPLIVSECSFYLDPGVIIDDACVNNSTPVIISGDTVDTNNLGATYTIYYDFTDDAGNVASRISRTVVIQDLTGPEIIFVEDTNPMTLLACSEFLDAGFTAEDPCTGADFTGNTVIDFNDLDLTTPGEYSIFYTSTDDLGNEGPPAERTIIVEENTYVIDAGEDVTTANCSETSVVLGASVPPSVLTGTWSVTSGQTSGFSFSDVNDANATFTGDVGETYTIEWMVDYGGGCADRFDQITISIDTCDALDFDGTDDNVTFRDNFNFNGDFSIEVWVKPELQSANIQTILSKRETNLQTDGYDLRLVNNKVSFNWNDGNSMEAPFALNTNTWHHVALIFNGSTYSMYIDGIFMVSSTGSGPITNTVDFILGAMEETIVSPTGQDLYLNGGLDELRIWNVALTESQIRKMMNQEIYDDGGTLKGKTVDLSIDGLSWSDLRGYYQMNQVSDLSSGSLLSSIDNTIDGTLRAMSSFQDETAPIPYETRSSGNWNDVSTWLHGNARSIPNGFGIDGTTRIDWQIVTIKHDIEALDRDITISSLIIEDNSLRVSSDTSSDRGKIEVADYLKLEGVNSRLILEGESQLIQPEGSIVDYSGDGLTLRDQQGTPNNFNYNYWSSPVSSDGNLYQVGSVLHDGDSPVAWTSALDGNANTNPITVSRRWLYLYENYPEDNYASWNAISENSDVNVGLGYIAKGTGSSDTEQNYTFKGKPNNGDYNIPITAGNQALVGNPYPSAIDANQFINDNSSSIQGSLYFWEHFETNNSHYVADYQGGYATYNLSGAVAAVSHPDISDEGTSSKLPERYVPVAQGFFVVSNATGGNINFNNNQRIFKKETVTGDGSGSVFMFRSTTVENEEMPQRIRFNYFNVDGAKRSLLLAFTPDNRASDEFDYGYDAINTEFLPGDASWLIGENNYVIQGVGAFSDDKVYPLFLKTDISGTVELEVDSFENFEQEFPVYLLDAVTRDVLELTNGRLSIELAAGDYNNRFYVVFRPNAILNIKEVSPLDISLKYLSTSKQIRGRLLPNLKVKGASLYNTLGQQVRKWGENNLRIQNNELSVPVHHLQEGLYIFNLETEQGPIQLKFLYEF